jgi:hypothetical protein
MAETDITIPPEALAAAKEAWYANHHRGTDDRMEITCLAMIRAWPHQTIGRHTVLSRTPSEGHAIILPLPEKPAHE